MQTIGFIGTGIMGQGMIRNLMKAGYPVQIYNRTRSKAEALEREGAVWKDSAAQCAAGCGVVITIVGLAPGDCWSPHSPGRCSST